MTKKRAGAGIEWRNIKVKLGWLQPWGHNPRMSSKKQAARILESFTDFGQVQTIAVSPSFDVYDGHQRLSALLTLYGADYEIDARQSSRALTDDERRRLVIALHAGAQGAWDWDALSGWDDALLSSAGMDADLLEQMNRDAIALREMLAATDSGASEADAEPQIDKADELQKKWQTAHGQVWHLGAHRLMCGDSTSAEDVARLMAGEKAFLIATDPPYGVDFVGAKYNPKAKAWTGIEGDKRQGDELRNWLAGMWRAWLAHTDEQSSFYSWCAAMEEGAAAAAMRDVGIHVQSQIIWNKNALVLGQADYQWKHENCWYGFLKGKKHRWMGGRSQTTVWEIDKIANSAYVHPMQKPTELYAIPMRNHTNEGDICAEPFSGSGSQLMAGEQNKRRVFAMEIAPEYVAVALQRWADATGKTPVLIDTLDTQK